MTELTYISTTEITNYTNAADLKVIILKTLARWFPNSYVFNECAVDSWVQKEGTDIDLLYGNSFQFELSIANENVYKLVMYANGRFRRQGSTCDFFEMILECLEFQINHPEKNFDTMFDCHEEEDKPMSYYKNTGFIPPSGVDSGKKITFEDEDDLIMNMPLREMNDAQIEKYVELSGRCPRDECEWTMVYNGDPIIRYSYCKFIQWGIEDQIVSNITISRATFIDITFTNYVFDNVKFEECVFIDIILNNTTFKNSTFIDCEFDSSLVPDKSCKVINYNEYDHYYRYEDSECEEEKEYLSKTSYDEFHCVSSSNLY
jgi:hypothetical protein